MTHPGAPQQFPQHGHHPQFPPPGQLPPPGPHPPQWGPGMPGGPGMPNGQWGPGGPGMPGGPGGPGMPGGPPARRGGKGPLIAVLVVLLVLGLGVGGYFVYVELEGDSQAKPVVDTSEDLEKAPIGCAMLEEAEVAPHIPGRMDYSAGGANPGAGQGHDQGQCNWNNSGRLAKDNVRGAFVIVTSYVYHANHQLSGVDKAKEHMEDRVRTGVAVHVEGADEAELVAQEKVKWAAEIVVRYRNVVYSVSYSNQTEGANVKAGATTLAATAIGKVVKAQED